MKKIKKAFSKWISNMIIKKDNIIKMLNYKYDEDGISPSMLSGKESKKEK